MSEFQLVYVTCSSKEEAQSLAKLSLEKKLIACANIFQEIESHYIWEGEVKLDKESVLVMKIKADNFEKLSEEVKANHSYDCPCILAFDIDGLNPDFASFLSQ